MIRKECQIGDCRLILGNCLEVLPTLEGIDAVVTDPPYGIGEARGKNKSRAVLATSKDYGFSTWDDKPCQPQTIQLMREASRWQIIFGGNYFHLPPSSCWLIWDKLNGKTDFADCEMAWTNLSKAVRRFQFRWHGMIRDEDGERVHPTQKPMAVMRWAMSHLPDGTESIADPFMGSGTTLVAAVQTGRKAIGIEIDERYYDIACRRVREAVGIGTLFCPERQPDADLFTN